MKTYDIIIPHCNAPGVNALAWACVKTVWQHSRNYNLIWVQNGGEIPASISAELDRCEKIEVICNSENLGFVKAVNQGIARSAAPFVAILNNDTRVPSGWLGRLQSPLLDPRYGLSGPLSSARNCWQGRTAPRCDPWIVPPHLNLAFFCVMTRREVIDQVGLLDEGFGLGLGDDDDYCTRVRAAGYDLALVTSTTVWHRHRSTFHALFQNHEIRKMQEKAGRRLAEKQAAATGNNRKQ